MTDDLLVEITDENFDEVVLGADRTVLVDFGADWCPDCRMIKPALAELAGDYAGRVAIGSLDTDAQPKTAKRFSIGVIPTLILFRAGEAVDKLVNVKDKRRIAEILDEVLPQ